MHLTVLLHLQPLLLLLPTTLATHIRLSIPSQPTIPSPSHLPPSTTAVLTTLHRTYSAPLRVDNTFDFRNVSSGSYLLDVHSHTHAFAPLRVDVKDGYSSGSRGKGEGGEDEEVLVWGTFRGNEWGNKGEVVPVSNIREGDVNGEGGKRIWGFEVKGFGAKEYLVERQGFSLMSIFKNPMILLAGLSMIIVFGMPYIMDNMDPEMRAEFENRQKSSSTPAANPLQNFDAAAWLAGKSTSGGAGGASGTSTPRGEVERGVSR